MVKNSSIVLMHGIHIQPFQAMRKYWIRHSSCQSYRQMVHSHTMYVLYTSLFRFNSFQESGALQFIFTMGNLLGVIL